LAAVNSAINAYIGRSAPDFAQIPRRSPQDCPGVTVAPTALPLACQRLLDAARDDGCVDFKTGCAFLGRNADSVSYRLAHRYMSRIAGGEADTVTIRPLRDKAGGWIEIPCHHVGGFRCRVDLLMPMTHPEVGWPRQMKNRYAGCSREALRGGWTASYATRVKP
jgi:hypothetical protein